MVNKTISLSEELWNKLKEVDNASGLIQNILIEYFQRNENPKDKYEEISKEMELKEKELISLKEKISEIEEKKRIIAEIEAQKIKKVEEYQEPDKWEKTKNMLRYAFENYEVAKEERDLLFNEFIDLLKENRVRNLMQFCNERNIKRKERKIE